MIGLLALSLLLAGSSSAQEEPAAPARYVRPEAWCRYLYDVRKYSWLNCLTAPVVPSMLLNEASDAADERKARVLDLAEKIKKADASEDVRALLDSAGAQLKPPMTERTFSAWLGKQDLDEVQAKLGLALRRFKPRQPLPEVDVKAAAAPPEGPDAFDRLFAALGTLDGLMSRLTSPRRASRVAAAPTGGPELDLPKLLEPLTEVRFTTAAAAAARAGVAEPPVAAKLRALLLSRREASPFPALSAGLGPLPPLDASAACADFSAFACGQWSAEHAGRAWSRRDEAAALTQARLRQALDSPGGGPASAFFGACAREPVEGPGSQALRAELARLASLAAPGLLAEELARLRLSGVAALLDVSAVPDPDDPGTAAALVDAEVRALPAASLERRAAAAFERFGETPQEAAADARGVVQVESALAGDGAAPERPVRLRLDDAERAAEPLALRRYLASLGAPTVDELLVADPQALRRLGRALRQHPLPRWKAYLRWRLIEAKASLLPRALRAGVADESEPRWRACARAAVRLLPQAAGRAYSERFLAAHDRNQASAAANAVRLSMEDRLREAAWLAGPTQQEAIRKLGSLTFKVGYPEQGFDAGAETAGGDGLAFANALELAALRRRLDRIGRPVERSRWSVSPASAAVAVSGALNEITVPAALLQRPFFAGSARAADNLGALGSVIGAALAQAVAADGRRYDSDGRLRDWWPAYDQARLETRAQCLPPSAAVDDLAVRAAYGALRAQEAGSPSGAGGAAEADQRFFLSLALSRCGEGRGETLNAVLANMPEFRAAFSCAADSPMASAPRCQVW